MTSRFSWLLAFTAAAVVLSQATRAAEPGPNVHYRGSLQNSRIRFESEKRGHVAFIGGSITEMNGYRPRVCKSLAERFPETRFTFTDAGIASTCSTTGAFRLQSDVLSHGPVDLFFIEFAVNDDQDAGHARRECIRGLEGIVRQTRTYNPNADLVVTFFVNPGMLETLQSGAVPISIGAHQAVARHYHVSTIHLAQEVADQVAAGRLTWQQFGGTHPSPRGNAICAAMIDSLFDAAWEGPLGPDAKARAHPTPDAPLDANHYGAGRFVNPRRAEVADGWTWGVPNWKDLPGSCRGRFADVPLLAGERSGAELTLAFEGKVIGAYVLAGPDAGVLEFSVDDGPTSQVNLFHRFSAGLHYPRSIIFDADLPPGRHTLHLRMSDENKSARILQFLAEGE